jgi:hypothetical protein
LPACSPWAQEKEENSAQPPSFRVLVARNELQKLGWCKLSKSSAEQAKKGKCVKRAISGKSFGAKKLNSEWPALARIAG